MRRRDSRFPLMLAGLAVLVVLNPLVSVQLGIEDPTLSVLPSIFFGLLFLVGFSVWASQRWARVALKAAQMEHPSRSVWLVIARNPDARSAACIVVGSAKGLAFTSRSASNLLPADQISAIGFGESGFLNVRTVKVTIVTGEVIHMHPLRDDAVLVDNDDAVDRVEMEMRAALGRL
jgi:hypothetical protein